MVALLRGGAWIEMVKPVSVTCGWRLSHSFAGVRGLKSRLRGPVSDDDRSHSFAGVRGLKFQQKRPSVTARLSRTPSRGCVD